MGVRLVFGALEYFVDRPRDESHLLGTLVPIETRAHRVRLPRARLSVCQNGDIVSLNQLQHQRFDGIHIDHLLRFVGRKCKVKCELILVVDHDLSRVSRLGNNTAASTLHLGPDQRPNAERHFYAIIRSR